MLNAVKPVQGQWAKMFPTEVNTPLLSLMFVKKIFAVAVSNIAYVRKLFPNNAFFDKDLEGISLKILKEEASCPGSCKVVFWLRSCFDAIEKCYLKKVILALYEDPKNPKEITESFSFGFRYDGNHASMNLSAESDKAIELPDEYELCNNSTDIKLQTKNMLQTILKAGRLLKPLPKKMMLTMKLEYFNETPIDYLPSGFKTDDSPELYFSQGSVNIKVGTVDTSFHSVRMIVHTSTHLFEKTTQSFTSPLNTKNNVEPSKHTITLKNGNICHTPRSSLNNNPEDIVNSENEPEYEVLCPCGVNLDCGIMILCDGCERWQHAVCFRIIDDNDVPVSHLCQMCCKSKPFMLTDNINCKTDLTLLDLSEDQQKSICLWRRALLLCVDNDVLSVGSITKHLSVEPSVAKGLLNKLQNEGAIKDVRGRGGNKAVLKAHVEGVLVPRYFSAATQNENMKNIKDIEKNHLSSIEKLTLGKRKNGPESYNYNNGQVNYLTRQTNSLALSKDNELQFLSQESIVSPGPQKIRRMHTTVNTPISIIPG